MRLRRGSPFPPKERAGKGWGIGRHAKRGASGHPFPPERAAVNRASTPFRFVLTDLLEYVHRAHVGCTQICASY